MTLLLKEPTIIILPTLAMKFGLREAVFLQQLHYRVHFSQTVIEDCKWYQCTIDNWLRQLPFLSKRTLHRIIQTLQTLQLIERLCFDGHGMCYRIRYEILHELLGVDTVPNQHECQSGSDTVPNCHATECRNGISSVPNRRSEVPGNPDISTAGGALRSKERIKERIIKESKDVLLYTKANGGQWSVDEAQVFQAVYEKLEGGTDIIKLLKQIRRACQQQLPLDPQELFGDGYA